jgi:hypothetical protein
MSNAKTEKALTQLLALSLVLQNIDDEDLVRMKFGLSMSLQEVVKFIGDAHGLDFMALARAAIDHLGVASEQRDDAQDLAAAAIAKAMGRAP